MNWLQSIELDEYIEGFERMGIHGAFMVGGASGQIRTTLFCCPLSFFPSPSPPLPSLFLIPPAFLLPPPLLYHTAARRPVHQLYPR